VLSRTARASGGAFAHRLVSRVGGAARDDDRGDRRHAMPCVGFQGLNVSTVPGMCGQAHGTSMTARIMRWPGTQPGRAASAASDLAWALVFSSARRRA
jgi:hypothetical protein